MSKKLNVKAQMNLSSPHFLQQNTKINKLSIHKFKTVLK